MSGIPVYFVSKIDDWESESIQVFSKRSKGGKR